MNPDFHPVVSGIYLLIGIQLILAFVLLLYKSRKSHLVLGLLCLLLGMWFFRRFFWDLWKNYPLLIVLIGGYKEVFLGPLAFFHTKLKVFKITRKEYVLHLIVPSLIYLHYVISRSFFPEYYLNIRGYSSWLLQIFLLFSYSFYLFLCLRLLKRELKKVLIQKAYIKVNWFIKLFFSFQILNITATILSTIANRVFPDSEIWITYINGYGLYYTHWILLMPLHIIMSVYVIIYALGEVTALKKFFLPKNIHVSKPSPTNKLMIEQKVKAFFSEEKKFKNNNTKIGVILEYLGITKKEFDAFIREKGFKNYSTYINHLKVEEFKSLVKNGATKKYDLTSLSEMAGFNSKATFHRVFKEMEGLTPSEYTKQNTSDA